MPVKDCCFLVSYIATFVGFILFLVAFAGHDWMNHEHGRAGLWVDCWHNQTEKNSNEECENVAKAEGPAYLELTRTFLILALVWEFIGVFGYNWCLPPANGPKTCANLIKARLQEISHFLAGVLTFLGVLCYGMNYYDYYTEEKHRDDVELSHGFYLASVSAGFGIIFSSLLFYSRSTGLRETHTKDQRNAELNKLKNKANSDIRKHWLNNKKVPTPIDQKEKDADVNDEVIVKESAMKKIVMPSNVILAFTRLKKGIGRKEEQAAVDREELEIEYLEHKESLRLDDAEHKFKGIFTVEGEVQNKSILSPPSSTRISKNTPTPRSVRIVTESDTTSTSSSSSFTSSSDLSSDESLMVTARDGAILPSANAAAAAVEDSRPPKNVSENVINGTAPPRQKVRRSVTTLKDNGDSKNWAANLSADPTPKKLKPKRHLSHGAIQSERSKSKPRRAEASTTSSIPGKSIYTLPGNNLDKLDNHPPPKYEEVIIGTHNHSHQVPEPVLTEQSKIYQPYSKLQ